MSDRNHRRESQSQDSHHQNLRVTKQHHRDQAHLARNPSSQEPQSQYFEDDEMAPAKNKKRATAPKSKGKNNNRAATKRRKAAQEPPPLPRQPTDSDDETQDPTLVSTRATRAGARRSAALPPDDGANGNETDGLSDYGDDLASSEDEAEDGDDTALVPLDQQSLRRDLLKLQRANARLQEERDQAAAKASAVKEATSNGEKQLIDSVVKTLVWHKCKFINSAAALDKVTEFVLNNLQGVDTSGWSLKKRANWTHTNGPNVSSYLCTKRNYAQSQQRNAVIAYCQGKTDEFGRAIAHDSVATGDAITGPNPTRANPMKPFSPEMMEKCVFRYVLFATHVPSVCNVPFVCLQ